MKLSDFDFDLPPSLIAQTPSPERGQSRLMVVHRASGAVEHRMFGDFPDFLIDRPVVVMNDTQVLPARLSARRQESPDRVIELLLVHEESPGLWRIMVRGLKKMRPGQRFVLGENGLEAEYIDKSGDLGRLRFSSGEALAAYIEGEGRLPLPHYIHRDPEGDPRTNLDRERYQTVYATRPGAIAAPTAGLHFNEEILSRVRERAVPVFLTLHVGPGTFQPVRTDDLARHKMKEEYYRVPEETWNTLLKAKRTGQKILTVGTTSTRVVESLDLTDSTSSRLTGWTGKFLYPGQRFVNTSHLLTNFHLPKSTLYLLVCAFAGKSLMEHAYQQAIREKYRFFSYGDAMLVL